MCLSGGRPVLPGGRGGSGGLCLLRSRGYEAGSVPVCFEYWGSISLTRGQDVKAGELSASQFYLISSLSQNLADNETTVAL